MCILTTLYPCPCCFMSSATCERMRSRMGPRRCIHTYIQVSLPTAHYSLGIMLKRSSTVDTFLSYPLACTTLLHMYSYTHICLALLVERETTRGLHQSVDHHRSLLPMLLQRIVYVICSLVFVDVYGCVCVYVY